MCNMGAIFFLLGPADVLAVLSLSSQVDCRQCRSDRCFRLVLVTCLYVAGTVVITYDCGAPRYSRAGPVTGPVLSCAWNSVGLSVHLHSRSEECSAHGLGCNWGIVRQPGLAMFADLVGSRSVLFMRGGGGGDLLAAAGARFRL